VDPREVEERLAAAGFRLRDRSRLPDDRGQQLRFVTGEVVTVYDTGTVVPQGQNQDRVREALGLGTTPSHPGHVSPSRTAFVVYGHDEQAKTQLEAMLRRWEVEPLILDQLPSEGATVIEKLEKYVARSLNARAANRTPAPPSASERTAMRAF
jgi:predicted nucleotide-binding protein